MKDLNIFCFGFGQVAKNFINKLNLEKIKFNLSSTSRDKTKKKNLMKLIIIISILKIKVLTPN